jgi:hypothetical protein
MASYTQTIDRREEARMMAGYTPSAVDHILKEAAKYGGKAGAAVMKGEAPTFAYDMKRQGKRMWYRRNSLSDGTFKRSVRAAAIRGRGSAIKGLQGRTVGVVIGPIGKNAFTRAWIELGTRHGEQGTHWVEKVASAALRASYEASDSVLSLYAKRTAR